MTEAGWLKGNDPEAMLRYLGDRASVRKLRLFACACVRRVWHCLTDETMRKAVDLAERYADGQATEEQMVAAAVVVYESAGVYDDAAHAAVYAADGRIDCGMVASLAAGAASQAAVPGALVEPEGPLERAAWWAARNRERTAQAGLVRELFSFRLVSIAPPVLVWQDGELSRIARDIYQERRFADLPILADALEDAGCANSDLIDHLRSPGPHVRGCFALDLVLCRE
jgi:hypothetical protein